MTRLITAILLVLPAWIYAQEIYMSSTPEHRLYKLDLTTCEIEELPYIPSDEQKIDLIHDLAFHPNGKLYASTYHDIVELDLNTGKARHLIRASERHIFLATLAINEEGRMIVSSGGRYFLDYDVLQNRLIPPYQFGPVGSTFTWGFYDASRLISHGTNQDFSRRYYWSVDVETGVVDTLIEFNNEVGYVITGLTKYYDDCKTPYYFGQAAPWSKNDENFTGFFGKIDFEKGTLDEICIGNRSESFIGLGSTDNFRHNGYLIDLDADNSSGHMTGGFYDTLTLCDPVGRIADEDISYRMCDEKIDSISFRIKSFGEPGPPDEAIIASEALRRTGEKRWTWSNPYGMDTDKISDFLRSVGYESDWSAKDSYERTVVTTTYIAGDSTSSWSVFQLVGTDNLAGRDTVVTYCGSPDFIDLRKYMSSSADRNGGRFEPSLSSGNTLFIPEQDPVGEYRYIVEKYGCIDTAVFTIKKDEDRSLGLKRYHKICRGTEIAGLVKVPHHDFDSVLWWNGDTTWQTEIQQDDHYPLWVRAMKDGCVYRDTLTLYETSGGILYESWFLDTILICKGLGKRVELRKLDSLLMNDQKYYKGDSIFFMTEGTYIFRGFREDCVIDKEIQVVVWDEQTSDFSKIFAWCTGAELTITLPEAESMEFSWSDGSPDPARTIDNYGEYRFRVSIGSCEAEDAYSIVPSDDCGGDCRVVIPNAVSPNGDGINDDLEILIFECGIFHSTTLLDKWGGVVFTTGEPRIGQEVWDPLATGVYAVQVFYEDEAGKVRSEIGSVLVLK